MRNPFGQRLRLAGSGLYGSAARTADEGPQTFAGRLRPAHFNGTLLLTKCFRSAGMRHVRLIKPAGARAVSMPLRRHHNGIPTWKVNVCARDRSRRPRTATAGPVYESPARARSAGGRRAGYRSSCMTCCLSPWSSRLTDHSSSIWRTVVTTTPWTPNRSRTRARSASLRDIDRSARTRMS